MPLRARLTDWTSIVPPLALITLALTWGRVLQGPLAVIVGLILVGAVLAAVHHAEVIAARVGEPLGSIILALAVTVIEVGLIVMSMSGPKASPTLARDTVFSAVMITTNGIVGLSLLINAGRHGSARFRALASGEMAASVIAITTVTMVLPDFTSTPGPVFSGPQLTFAALASFVLYALFVSTQTNSHRDYFLPLDKDGDVMGTTHAEPPGRAATWASTLLLLGSLVAVVGLAKIETPPLERAITVAGLPSGFVGIVIALLVLAPETLAAANAARRDRVQTSMNLAYGSAMASVGLTIPALAITSRWLPVPLHLGLDPLHIALLALTTAVTVFTILMGRATRLQAGIHLTILASFIFLAAAP